MHTWKGQEAMFRKAVSLLEHLLHFCFSSSIWFILLSSPTVLTHSVDPFPRLLKCSFIQYSYLDNYSLFPASPWHLFSLSRKNTLPQNNPYYSATVACLVLNSLEDIHFFSLPFFFIELSELVESSCISPYLLVTHLLGIWFANWILLKLHPEVTCVLLSARGSVLFPLFLLSLLFGTINYFLPNSFLFGFSWKCIILIFLLLTCSFSLSLIFILFDWWLDRDAPFVYRSFLLTIHSLGIVIL